jgi:hypothetical protein
VGIGRTCVEKKFKQYAYCKLRLIGYFTECGYWLPSYCFGQDRRLIHVTIFPSLTKNCAPIHIIN